MDIHITRPKNILALLSSQLISKPPRCNRMFLIQKYVAQTGMENHISRLAGSQTVMQLIIFRGSAFIYHRSQIRAHYTAVLHLTILITSPLKCCAAPLTHFSLSDKTAGLTKKAGGFCFCNTAGQLT